MRKSQGVESATARTLRVCCGATVLLCVSSSWGAMEIQGIVNGTEPASNYDRFDNSPAWIGNPVNWPGGPPGVNNPNPWEGVGRDATQGRWATLISPSFIVSAAHYAPSNGDTIDFYWTNDPNLAPVTRTVVASEALQGNVPGDGSDVWIGELSSPVTGMASYPILKLPTQSSDNTPYGGLGISTFGLSTSAPGTATSVRLGRNVINSGNASSSYYTYSYNYPGVGPDESQLIVGDSGGPSFFLYAGGTPALLGLHWFNDAPNDTTSGDTWLTNYVSDIQTGINQLGNPNNETVKTISPLLGDFNLDGHVTAADIPAMEKALANLSSYQSTHGMNNAYLDYIGDFNHDGVVNDADLQALINLLKTHSDSRVALLPEPNTFILAVLAIFLCCLFCCVGGPWRVKISAAHLGIASGDIFCLHRSGNRLVQVAQSVGAGCCQSDFKVVH